MDDVTIILEEVDDFLRAQPQWHFAPVATGHVSQAAATALFTAKELARLRCMQQLHLAGRMGECSETHHHFEFVEEVTYL